MKYLAKQWKLGLIRQAGCTRNLFFLVKSGRSSAHHFDREGNSIKLYKKKLSTRLTSQTPRVAGTPETKIETQIIDISMLKLSANDYCDYLCRHEFSKSCKHLMHKVL
jgi:hypothetical protein